MDEKEKCRILGQPHDAYYDSIKTAASTEAKLDLFLEFFWKCTMNDIQHIQGDLRDLKKTVWRAIGFAAGAVAAVEFFLRFILHV